jgi:gliding motility-associated-like protein
MRFFYFLFLLSLLSISINAQITITPGGTATSIINTFVSNGIVVTNPIINCGSTSYGSYTGNLQAGGIGLSNGGIILTTGSAVGADGPNTSTLFGLEVLGYDYADPQLTSQPGAGTPPPSFDNCRVEFDMTPICSSFNIAFVFGSEEYPEYVTGAYNDGFGIFVSGPNPLGGNYSSYNMARLPNGQLVSIDNVNSNLNNSYYNTNNTGVMQYDGYTDGLTAQLAVIPCSTYHVKIIIADAGDQLWDSGIFLGAGSFACSMPALSITALPTTICAGASTTLTASTAAAGGTYLWSPGGATTQSITVNPLTTTTYTCSYTFSSCSVITATTTVTVATITPSFQPIGPYCSGETIPVFSTSSTNGISGTWSPAINNTASTTYTFTPTAGQCATTQTRTVTITPNITPLFTQVGSYCSGATIPPLPTNSINGITGTWSPVINNTSTTTYTFTPTAGQCATTQTRTVTITPNITPLFTQVGPYCSGATIPPLPTNSINGISGTWSPAINNSVSTTYTFTPTAGQCGTTQIMSITITPNINPLFTQVGPYCSGATIPPLPTNSINGISGTWSPAINNTASTTYTFTPTAGQCGTTQTRTVTITPNITSLFTQVGPYCSGATIPSLQSTSTNGITGTWSPAINNTASTTYTFTPTAGQCATTQTMSIIITPNITPLFTQVGPYCSGATIPPLPTNSINGISGTWSPAINNTASTTYTFTPTAGQCATTQTRTVTITPNITPLFTQVGPYCSGATIPPLPTNSINGITGTWFPAINNTASTTYTFTPTAGQCATTQTRTVTITPNITPLFTQFGPYCSGATTPVFSTSSTNGITGTWSPAINNTVSTTYTFTPTAGQCATTQTMSITITPNITPLFTQVGPYCSGATIPPLLSTSINGITGTWSPALSNTASTTYTFSPTLVAGQCNSTQTMSITITPNITPLFTQVGPYCSGATIPPLLSTSINGITGTWSPALSNIASTTYTFSPTLVAGQCNSTQTMSITITPNITPLFTQVGPYCSGATIPSLPTNSINGITGTWSPVINNTSTTTYTFTPTAGQCATTQTRTVTITPNITPLFTQVGPYCSGSTIPSLLSTSINGISGTWSPAINNTSTTTYTFTPTAGQCATTQTMSITITPNITPLFTQVGPYCSGATIPPLPTNSINGITGTWSPVINNTSTTTYTFTPTAGLCATTQTMTISINLPILPSFTQVGPFCIGNTISELPTSSINGISGTWAPAINNIVTTTYTFTPTAGLCATTQTMNIVISQNTTPTFSQVGPFCSAATISPLPISSTNGISGTWSPAINNTATTTYTFTPTAGLCATTQTMSITITPNASPLFTQVGPYCSGATIPVFSTSSTNGISGTWSPAINNTASTTYTFTPTAGQCATTQTRTVTITPNITPLFTQVGSYCSGATIPSLLSTSINGITGTWSPAINNTATTTYTFTPTAGLCATTQTVSITITPNASPLFTQVGPYCSGATIPPLATNSTNSITGIWSPAINNTATTTYTFTPTAVQCATNQTISITITPNITPLFTQVGPYCSGATIPPLATNSINSITGTWSPAIDNTATTTYTFTPTASQCATTQTMSITITPNITPLFTQVGPYCSGATIPPLLSTSINGITGTWSPALSNTASTTYTFSPTLVAGQCNSTQTMSITITPNITPLFTQVGPYCSGATISPLPTSSINGISGTWAPAINNAATTSYTFTPTSGLCATIQTISISINLPTLPSFTQVGPFCIGNTISALPTSSINGISGTWGPAINNTATTTYTFTPTAGLCATMQTMSIAITQPILPNFMQVGPFCSGATISPLPISSTNGISGTWTPAINNTATTTYTFTPTAVLCATTEIMSITITPNITPLFTQVGPYCSGATIPPLATNSTNSITGTWSPAINNTASTTYTFTPTASQCATTQTMSITITPNITPLFTQVSPYCIGATISSLPTSSINGISGTWGPEINNSATTTYTFTPTAGLCATTQTMSISINLPTLPSFTQVGPYCSGATIPSLLSTSINGITGTWLPAINNSATTTYTFTPTADLCATSQTMNIVISQNTTPTFSQVGPFCSEASISPLPTSSTNGISGTWGPAINNTATTTYTFTPTAGLCATTQTMSITITPNASPLFIQVGPFCSGGTISPLPTSSTNGISGIWSPAINNAATTTYTFSPTLITGECASTQTMSIIISPIITSTWSEVVCVSELPFLWNGISYNGAGIYSYYTETAGGCDSTAILNLSISPTPLTSFIPSISLFTESPQLVAFTNTTVGASSYSWDFGDGSYSTDDNPEHVFAENTNGQTITLFAESSEGCIGTYQVSIEFDEGLVYYIPNTFTPDHDEYNQTFRPIFTSGFDPYNYEMLIFNRWGEIIFETHDVTYGWDGTYSFTNSICQDGVYSYKIAFKNPILDERKVVCGSVNLLK